MKITDEQLNDKDFAAYLRDILNEEASQDGEDDMSQFDNMSAKDIYEYLLSNYDYDDDELHQQFSMATDVDGDGNIDLTAEDSDGDGDVDKVDVKEGKGSVKAGRVKSSILDDDYKTETPEEIDIRKALGVGGKFKPETKEEQSMLDSTGTVTDSDESDDSSWADIVGALKDYRY